jgi:catechol 2,3-dioxygenase-like lactoylglutathione lyase family enzyme
MGLDHVMVKVSNWSETKEFYEKALAPLGYKTVADWGTGGGFGTGEKIGNIYFKQESSPTRIHFAISAPTAEAVQSFYDTALKHGGIDNGAPGPRGHNEGGSTCFIIDKDNNNVEVDYRP